MNWMDFIATLIEVPITIAFSCGMVGFLVSWRRIIVSGLIAGLLVFMVTTIYTAFKIPVGTNIILNIIIMIFVIRYICKLTWLWSFVGVISAALIAILTGALVLPMIFNYFKINFEILMSNPRYFVLGTLAQDIGLIVGNVIMYGAKVSLIKQKQIEI